MRVRIINKISISLNIILAVFLFFYFLVPFSNNGFLVKVFSPCCWVIEKFQGEDYMPGWCALKDLTPIEQPVENANTNGKDDLNENENINTNINTNTNSNDVAGLANPASVKCAADGGSLEMITDDQGEKGLCVFKDQSICDEWAYFRGECQSGKCFKECQKVGTAKEGWYNSCTGEVLKLEICGEKEEDQTVKNIIVTEPLANAQLSSPFAVAGRAKTVDNNVYVRVKNLSGQILIEDTIALKNIGADGFGNFSYQLSYEFSTTKEGFLEIYAKNSNGEDEDSISLPVKF